jgi:hypothetical protein
MGHLVCYLWLEAWPPKPTQSRGIGSQPSRTPSHGNHRKHPNRSHFVGFVGSRSPSKEAQGPHTLHPTRIPQRNAPKSSPRKIQEKTLKITKKEKQEQHIQALRNHAKSSIHTKEVHTRSSLPPDHPSLSQDLTMKLSS